MRGFVALLAGVLAASSASAIPPVPPPPPPAPPPRLLIAISVDQFSADLFDEYRTQFTGGLARIAGGVTFRNGYQAHAATETCPGHSTILTGSHPAHTGIIANNWIDQSIARGEKSVYCAEDETKPKPSGDASYVVSPVHLHSATLGDQLKQVSPQSWNVAVAGKDRAAVMMGGRRVDQRWYWDGKQFVTDLAGVRVPAVVGRANAAVAGAIAQPREALAAPPTCEAKSAPIRLSNSLTVGDHRFARAAGDAKAFRNSPEFDGSVLALAAGLVQELGLGRDTSPDLLSVGLSATDYVGHAYGAGGGEMCLQLLSLDRDLGDFLKLLDRSGLDYAVVLTADHGGMDIPERLRVKGKPSIRANAALSPAVVGKQLAAQFGGSGSVLVGEGIGGDVWIDKSVRPADRPRVLAAAISHYKAKAQVEDVFDRATIMNVPMPSGDPSRWTLLQRVRASYDPARSGDFYVVLKQYVSPIAEASVGYVATHGSPWDYDRRVPILFWRPGIAPVTRNEAISTVDILPTLQAMLALKPTPGIDGHCLTGISGIACPPR